MKNALINGDSLDILKKLPNNSFDSMVTDPPAGIAFMGKKWDKDKGGRKLWIAWLESIMTEAFRTLKPGAHILVWAIPRTSHWTATAIENADFEIRDVVTHIFGSGFPKSHNIGKKIKEFEGWGTALKPASEHWILARKPLSEKTIAANVLEHGTGGINIDASRISYKTHDDPRVGKEYTHNAKAGLEIGENKDNSGGQPQTLHHATGRFPANLILSHKPGCKQVGTKEGKGYTINRFTDGAKPFGNGAGHPYEVEDQGPETIAVWDCDDDCAIKTLDNQTGILTSGEMKGKIKGKAGKDTFGSYKGEATEQPYYADSGGASRYFKQVGWNCEDDCAVKQLDEQSIAGGMHSAGKKRKCCKSKQSGEGGLFSVGNHEGNGVRFGDKGGASRFFYCAKASKKEKTLNKTIENKHPTVKSLKLMKYLINLVTPPGGVVLDPFMGSGTTGQAALEGKFGFVGIELEAESFEICKARCSSVDNIIINKKIEEKNVETNASV
jgi:DNA modification methylase